MPEPLNTTPQTNRAVPPHTTQAVTLFENIRGYTLVGENLTQFSAMAIQAGKVLATGDVASLGPQYPQAQRRDGQGKTLLPGMIDVHCHVFSLGFRDSEVMLANAPDATDLPSTLAKVKQYAKDHPERSWIRGWGWNQATWGLGRNPTAIELDQAEATRPVALRRIDGHTLWANSQALLLAGIDRNTPDPEGGHIERDAQGNPTGILVDHAQDLVFKAMPRYTLDESRQALSNALAQIAAFGLTSVGDAIVNAFDAAIYKEFADAGRLTARVYGMILEVGADFKTLSANGPLTSYADDMLALRTVKLFCDGALGSRGAALLQPYTDAPEHQGLLFMSDAALQAKMETALAAGYQVNVHAIGDAANRQVLNSFEAAYQHVGGRHLRNRIEHAQVVAPEDMQRYKALDLIASMQPTHATSDINIAEDRLGSARMRGAYACNSFLKQGTVLAFGSDFPVESPNPFEGLFSAVMRTDHNHQPPGGWHPEEALTLAQAFRAFTLDAAYAQHQEHCIGSLEPGKWADFILIDQDIFNASPKDLWKVKVLETWVAGKQVYAASSPS